MPYLSDTQRTNLTELLAKEVALTETVSGERFEVILAQVLDEASHIDRKLFFDVRQPDRGIEAKTYKLQTTNIGPGSSLRNVLKRIPPDGMPDDIMYQGSEDIQVDTSVSAERAGAAVLKYLKEDLIEAHADTLKISGSYDYAVLFRNKAQNKMGYWEEPIDVGDPSEFDWQWTEKALEGEKNGENKYKWYYANQRQLFYYFVAPDDVDIMVLPEYPKHDVGIFTKEEIIDMMKNSYDAGKDMDSDELNEEIRKIVSDMFPKPEESSQSELDGF